MNNTKINNPKFIRLDDGMILNTKFIRWMKKTSNGCIRICSKMSSCVGENETMHICPGSKSFTIVNNFYNEIDQIDSIDTNTN